MALRVDAVVVGGGHHGLVAAAVLADAGWEVCLLEAADHLGGAVRSAQLRPGYVTDLYSAFYPLTAASPVLRSLEDFIVGQWEAQFLALDPNNLLSQADKWFKADVSVNDKGNLATALGKITAKTFVVSFTGDRIFTRKDCEADAALIPRAQLRYIDSVWGPYYDVVTDGREGDRPGLGRGARVALG